jgi:very-short-patch-repair endonuclease
MSGTKDLCREFRKNPTKAEDVLWEYLRANRLSGYKFRRQYPIMGYIVDFYCSKAKLAIEVDGGVHLDPNQVDYDQHKGLTLAQNDIVLIRFWNDDVISNMDEVEKRILKTIEQRVEKRRRN